MRMRKFSEEDSRRGDVLVMTTDGHVCDELCPRTTSVTYLWIATLFTLDVLGCREKTKTQSDFSSSEKISSSG